MTVDRQYSNSESVKIIINGCAHSQCGSGSGSAPPLQISEEEREREMSPPASSIAFCLPRGPAWKASSRITGGDHPSVALPLRRCPSPPPPGGARKQDVKMFFGFGSKTETKTKTETETEDATSQWNLVKDTFRGVLCPAS
jgi:hypothetical protein